MIKAKEIEDTEDNAAEDKDVDMDVDQEVLRGKAIRLSARKWNYDMRTMCFTSYTKQFAFGTESIDVPQTHLKWWIGQLR